MGGDVANAELFREVPNELVEVVCRGECIIFAGAGVSQPVFPGWKELLQEMLNQLVRKGEIRNSHQREIAEYIEQQDFLLAADTLSEVFRGMPYFIRDKFRPDIMHIGKKPSPTRKHELLVDLNPPAIITTNFDDLFEQAYARKGRRVDVYTYDDEEDMPSLVRRKEPYIFKAHGDAAHPERIILTTFKYRELLYRNPAYRLFMQTLFLTKVIFFVGYSMRDPDIQMVLDTIGVTFRMAELQHWALIPDDEHELAVKRLQSLYNISPICYKPSDGHPEVTIFLEKLCDAVRLRRDT